MWLICIISYTQTNEIATQDTIGKVVNHNHYINSFVIIKDEIEDSCIIQNHRVNKNNFLNKYIYIGMKIII